MPTARFYQRCRLRLRWRWVGARAGRPAHRELYSAKCDCGAWTSYDGDPVAVRAAHARHVASNQDAILVVHGLVNGEKARLEAELALARAELAALKEN